MINLAVDSNNPITAYYPQSINRSQVIWPLGVKTLSGKFALPSIMRID